MQTSPPTRPSLLIRLRDPRNAEAWSEFVELYAPMVHEFYRRRGLQDADSSDVAQEVFRAVFRALPGFRYDSERGTFRGWLFTVVRSKLNEFLTRLWRQPAARGGTTMQEIIQSVPDREHEEDWDRAWRLHIFKWAAERVRKDVEERTWKAFWETAVRSRPAGEVATELAMTPGAVYVARSRVLARVRSCIEGLEGAQGEASDEGEGDFNGEPLPG